MPLKRWRFLRNSATALFLSCLVITLSACVGTRAYKLPSYGVTGNASVNGISYNKILGILSSYSTLNGRLKSKPDDYVEIGRNGSVAFFGHKNHVGAAVAVLNKPCCHDGKTSANNIAEAVQWTRGLFNLGAEIQVEVFLVPDSYNYQYVTRHRIKGHRAKVRFAFHYFDERPVPKETYFIEKTISTLTHELTHVYFQLGDRLVKNDISDETAASVVGVCARTRVTTKVPITVSHITFVNAEEEEILPKMRKISYLEVVNKLKDDNPPTIIGQILTTLIVEKMDKKYGYSDKLASEKMLGFCQHIVTTRHDFTKSMGFEE